VARPGELPLGVLARVELRASRGFVEREAPLEVGGKMRNAMRAHDRQRGIEPALHERRDFVERAPRKHGVEPRVDARPELCAIGRKVDARPFPLSQRRLRSGAEERSEGASRRVHDFERAQDPLPVAHVEARGGLRVARPKLVVKLGCGAPLRPASDGGAHCFGHGRDVRQAFGERAKIEPCAASENDWPLADLGENLSRRARPSAGRKIDRAVDCAEQPVRRELLLVRRRPGGQDLEVQVDLHRISVDDRCAEPLREGERRHRLAARRRACDEERAFHPFARLSGSVMSVLVATLVADPVKEGLSEATIDRAAQALGGVERRRWLGDGVAADLVLTGELKPKRAALEQELADEPVDVIVQSLARRRKRLLVADMDSTLIGQECVDELADFAGVGERVAAITERAMRGEIAFAPALRERVALLGGLPETVIGDVLKDRIRLNPGARTLARTMRANGAYVVIVSGGFRQFTRAIRERLGADEDRANTLMIQGGKLTGKVVEPILGQDAKLGALKEIAAAMGLELDDTLAVGDGANDLAMLEAAGLGVAYRAKPKVAARAHARIEHSDLTTLLYAQGFMRKDFVEG